MAHSLSAKKRIRQNETRRSRNRARKSTMRDLTKAFDEAIAKGDQKEAQTALAKLTACLDATSLRSTMHKNTAARKKSQAAKKLAQLKAK
ncbi:MAG: 30S ribosomal protein S20 [Actinobacteria bacterium]|nr:30S ribosomal protein S20 [Actinomycetota bacterium]